MKTELKATHKMTKTTMLGQSKKKKNLKMVVVEIVEETSMKRKAQRNLTVLETDLKYA